MGIRFEHQGAGAGAGIDLVAQQKRKYDLQMKQQDLQLKQQEKQQDRMFNIGMQNRGVALQRENMLIGNNLRMGEWTRDQKAIEDQRKLAASNARAMRTGTIKSSIEMGDYDPKDAAKLQGFLDYQDQIIADPETNDAQKADALSQLDGMMAPYLERKLDRTPKGPVPYEQADPKLQGQILADVYKRLNESGRQYTDAEARALARDDYNDRVGISQAPQLGGQAPTEGDSREMTPRVAQLVRPGFSQHLRQDRLFGPAPSGQSGQTVPMQGTPGQERLYGPAPVKKPTTGFEASQNTKEFAPYRAEAEKDIEAEYQRKLQEWNDGDGDPNRPEKPAPPTRQEKQALAEKYWDDDYKRVQQADWSDFDKKNYGNGYVNSKGKKFIAIPGATVKPHVWEGGDKGFAVEGDDGLDHLFSSEAAAKAFAATGEQEGGQSPQQGGAPPQQAAPQKQAAAEPEQQGAAPQQDWATADGFKPAPNATITPQDGGFVVPTDKGQSVTFRTEEEARRFASGGQAAAPQVQPQQAAPPVPAEQRAPSSPAAMGWDQKIHGDDFKGHKPRAGATVEDYTFQSGHKGFKVLKEGGGARTFASREMAEAFLASGGLEAQPTEWRELQRKFELLFTSDADPSMPTLEGGVPDLQRPVGSIAGLASGATANWNRWNDELKAATPAASQTTTPARPPAPLAPPRQAPGGIPQHKLAEKLAERQRLLDRLREMDQTSRQQTLDARGKKLRGTEVIPPSAEDRMYSLDRMATGQATARGEVNKVKVFAATQPPGVQKDIDLLMSSTDPNVRKQALKRLQKQKIDLKPILQ